MNFPKNFIKATEEYNTFDNAVPSPYFRKKFTANKQTDAKILIAACGFYELYLNGQKITRGYFSPYVSNPDDYIYYDQYEVVLNEGENVIAVQLGNGFQNNPGGHIWEFDTATFRSAPNFALSCSFIDADGAEKVIESSTDFKTNESPIRYDDYRFGECYDANFEIDGWNTVDFDDSDWKNAIAAVAPKGEARIAQVEPIKEQGEIKPIEIIPVEDGYIYDFGINYSGVCRLTVSGEKGQRIELRHAEQILNGDIDLESVWFVRKYWYRDKDIVHNDVYICKGEGIETYTPTFTYHGFRYVKVSGITEEQATKDLLTYVKLNTDLKVRGGFSTSHETTQTLQDITVRSDLSNFHHFPTDCPQREKNGWTADAALSCEQMLLNINPEKSYREWMYNIRKAQNAEGALPGIIPTTGWGFHWGNGPAWDCVLAYLPFYTYVYRGETEMITESADSFILYLKYLESRKDEKGLMHIGLGDWCHVGRELPVAPLEVTDSIISMDIANKMAVMFDAVGMSDKREYALSVRDNFKKAIRDNLIDFETMTVKGDCQTCQSMGLYYGVFEEEERQKAFEVLLKFVDNADNHMDVGVLGGKVIFEVLSDFGYSDLALLMITRPDFPSYGNWLERGATTLWEKMELGDVEYSKNHHFWGYISAWFIKYLAGIRYNPNGTDISEVNISPNFVKVLPDASSYYESKFGKIACNWKRENGAITLNVTVPANMHGSIILPDGYHFDDGTSVKEVKSGTYMVHN